MILRAKILKIISASIFLSTLIMTIILGYFQNIKPTFLKHKPLIVVDAGHGGIDSGAFHGQLLEKDLNLEIAYYLLETLEKEGFEVIMTRTEDVMYNNQRREDLERRVEIAQEVEADLFLSIHVNKYPSSQPFGGEVFYHPQSSGGKELAHCIQKELLLLQADSYRSIKEGDFFVLRKNKMPSVIIEVGFLSNEQDRIRLQNKGEKKEIARAITRGVKGYLKGDYQDLEETCQIIEFAKQSPTPTPKEDSLCLYYITKEGLPSLVKHYVPIDYYTLMAQPPQASLQAKLVQLALKEFVENTSPHISPLPPSTNFHFLARARDLRLHLSFADPHYYGGSTMEVLAYEALRKTLAPLADVQNIIIINEGNEMSALGNHLIAY